MKKLIDAIDALNRRAGELAGWLILAMVLVGAYNALASSLGKAMQTSAFTTNMLVELQWYLFGIAVMLGAGATLQHGGHVRVDVLYDRLSPRARRRINIAGAVLFLLPFCAVMLWTSWDIVARSWAIREQSPDPSGLPRYPLKTFLVIGFALLFLQGVSALVRSIREQPLPESTEGVRA